MCESNRTSDAEPTSRDFSEVVFVFLVNGQSRYERGYLHRVPAVGEEVDVRFLVKIEDRPAWPDERRIQHFIGRVRDVAWTAGYDQGGSFAQPQVEVTLA